MARPDFSQVSSGLQNARSKVQEAKGKVGEDAVPHLEAVEEQLVEAERRLEDALAQADEASGGRRPE